jgi:hypothetical protein
MLLLPSLPGSACACLAKNDLQEGCSHCSRRVVDASHHSGKSCCIKHRDTARKPCCQRHADVALDYLGGRDTPETVCRCQQSQSPQSPAVPVGHSPLTTDQLLQLQAAVSQPLPTATPTLTATSICHDSFLLADTSLERCILLSRLTL